MWRENLERAYREAAGSVIERLRQHPSVRGLALFGSVVAGRPWEGSDIDVLMLVERLDADWQALELCHGPWRIHLQVIKESTFEHRGHLLRAAALGEMILGARVVYDPRGIMRRMIEQKREEALVFQFTEIMHAVTRFLTEFRNAQKQLSQGDADGAFLYTNMAFAALSELELARLGYAPGKAPVGVFSLLPADFVDAYRALTAGPTGLKKRVRLAFCYFDRKVGEIVASIGPSVVHAVERAGTPMPIEDFGELPEIANTSDEVQYLIDTLEQHGVILLTRRQAQLAGRPLEGFESLMMELSR